MNSNSDPDFEKFKDYDFADAQPVQKIPALAALQAEAAPDKAPVALYLDADIVAALHERADTEGKNWRELINETLRAGIAARAA
jgi:uncharacterized protein (DUF4415 family)